MSNEYKEWLRDRVVDILIDADLIDCAREVHDASISGQKLVYGLKNNAPVAFAVWWDSTQQEWHYERREINI